MKTTTMIALVVIATLQFGCETTETTAKDGTVTKTTKSDAGVLSLGQSALNTWAASRNPSDGKQVR